MPIFDLFPGRNTWDPEETRNSSFWLMKTPRYGPFLHGEWRQLFLLFPVLDREMRATDASIDVTYECLFARFIPSFMESSSSLTRLVTSDEPSTYSSIYRKKFCD